jgi:hypothetical protein
MSVDAKAELIKIAAEMARGKNMPSEFVEDWEFTKTTPDSAKRMVIKCAGEAHDQTRIWAIKLINIANALTDRVE